MSVKARARTSAFSMSSWVVSWRLFFSVTCVGIVGFAASESVTSSRPNVLLIVVDDLRPALGCYQTSDVLNHPPHYLTPNIDTIAYQGVTFTHAFAQQALCAPSRTSFLTSRRPDRTKVYDLHTYWRSIAGNFTTLPQYFKENGYHAASVGKVFHPGLSSNFSDDSPYSWSQMPYHPSTQEYMNAKVCPNADGSRAMNLVCPVDLRSQPEHTLPDIQSREFARQFLRNFSRNGGGNPFFLAVGFHKPHLPLKYPNKYLDLYPLREIGIAPNHTLPPGMPLVAWNPWFDIRKRDDVKNMNVSFPYGPLPLQYQRLVRQSYFAATTYTDDQIGFVLSSLQTNGFSDSTIVLLIGDHGWTLGERQDWAKFSNFETATHVPLIVSVPNLTNTSKMHWRHIDPFRSLPDSPQQTNLKSLERQKCPNPRNYLKSDALVELVDVFPSLAEFSGLATPKPCPENSSHIRLCSEGKSFVPVVKNVTKGKTVKWKSGAFSQYPRPSDVPQGNSDEPKLKDIKIMGYRIRTERYSYTEWVGFDSDTFYTNWTDVHAIELYDLHYDIGENHNLAKIPRFEGVVRKLSKRLVAGWSQAV